MDAKRFAALWSGCDTQNENEAEAVGKFRLVRRMAVADGVRIIDAMEQPGVRKALDDQMQPARRETPDAAALEAENEDLRRKLAVAMPKVRKLAEDLAVVRKARKIGIMKQVVYIVFLEALGWFSTSAAEAHQLDGLGKLSLAIVVIVNVMLVSERSLWVTEKSSKSNGSA